MVSEADVVKAVARLKVRVAKEFPIERVVLFGSLARGDARPDSDVDLIFVSAGFEGKTLVRRTYPLRRAWDLKVPVDILCFTPAEFERQRMRPSLVSMALAEGHEITA